MIKKIVVLILFVLFILSIGFALTWNSFWKRALGFYDKENVDSIVQACNVACTMQAENEYCVKIRKVNTGEERIDGTCHDLGKNPQNLGFKSCEQITCS